MGFSHDYLSKNMLNFTIMAMCFVQMLIKPLKLHNKKQLNLDQLWHVVLLPASVFTSQICNSFSR